MTASARDQDRRRAQEEVRGLLRATFVEQGIADPLKLAWPILLLLDGSFAVVLLHRDASYMETAGEAARTLIETALAKPRRKRGEGL